MRVFMLSAQAEEKYSGTGYALAALQDGVVVNLVYLRDVIAEFREGSKPSAVKCLIDDPRVGVASHAMSAEGVHPT